MALALGMSVRRLLAEVDSAELAEWSAYAALEGMPESRADYRSAQLCALMANIHRVEGAKPLTPADFVPPDIMDDESESDEEGVEDDAVLLPDPEAHSRLIMSAIFGIAPLETPPPKG